MTREEKARVSELREQGRSYKEIAVKTGLQLNTIKSFCQRHGMGERFSRKVLESEKNICPQCGAPLDQHFRTKPRRFCSDSCRRRWWTSHPEQIRRNAVYSFICAHCGKTFTAYGNGNRKYCCHSCYTAARFGKGVPAT